MKELVLTGYDPFWPGKATEKNQIVFLGSWCFSGNTEALFSDQKRYKILDSPYKNWQDVRLASIYVEGLIEKILDQVTLLFNKELGLALGRTFWEHLLIAKLVHVVDMMYDRYLCLSKIKDCNEPFAITVADITEYIDFSNYDKDFFTASLFFNEGNLFLFSHMLLTLKGFENHKIIKYPMDSGFWQKAGVALKQKQSKSFRVLFEECTDYLVNFSPKLYLGRIAGMGYLDKMWLRKNIFGWKKLLQNVFLNIWHLRSFMAKKNTYFHIKAKRIGLETTDDFEEWLDAYLLNFIQIPTRETILEALDNKSKIWIGMDIYSEKCLAIAASAEKKGKWFSVQHGGGYGHFYVFPIGRIEYKTATGYFSWGWEYNHVYQSNNIKYLPSPILAKIAILGKNKSVKKAILISTSFPAYLYRYHSTLLPRHNLEYIEARIDFMQTLQLDIRKELYYRPYFSDYGKKEMNLLAPWVQNTDAKVYRQPEDILKNYELVIVDHLATSNLLTFAMNKPTILFFQREHFEYCEEAKPYFQKLIDAGIMFHDEKLAAEKVNEIWENPTKWWNQPEVQKAKDEFCYMYARTSSNWREEWTSYLKGITKN